MFGKFSDDTAAGDPFEDAFGRKSSVDELITGVSSLTLCRNRPLLGDFRGLDLNGGSGVSMNRAQYYTYNNNNFFQTNNFFHTSENPVPVFRSKNCIRNSPSIRNLRAKSFLLDNDSHLFDKSQKSITTTTTEGEEKNTVHTFSNTNDLNMKDGPQQERESSYFGHVSSMFWFLLRQIFWSVCLLVNIFLMFWIIFGSPYDPVESHWLHHALHNATEQILTTTPLLWESVQNSFFELLSARDFTIL